MWNEVRYVMFELIYKNHVDIQVIILIPTAVV